VRDHLTQILHGKAGTVIANLRRKATCQRLPAAKKKTLRTICDFLAKNKHRMRYDAVFDDMPARSFNHACRHWTAQSQVFMERVGIATAIGPRSRTSESTWRMSGSIPTLRLTRHKSGLLSKPCSFSTLARNAGHRVGIGSPSFMAHLS
jgi:hypothetical protein